MNNAEGGVVNENRLGGGLLKNRLQWKKGPCLFTVYRGYTTQLPCSMGMIVNHENDPGISQPGFNGK